VLMFYNSLLSQFLKYPVPVTPVNPVPVVQNLQEAVLEKSFILSVKNII
jgi:hypothetical protein